MFIAVEASRTTVFMLVKGAEKLAGGAGELGEPNHRLMARKRLRPEGGARKVDVSRATFGAQD
jgi:hypothetical protein